MQEYLAAIDKTALGGKPLPVSGLDTDSEAVADILERARLLRAALCIPGCTSDELQTIAGAVAKALRDGDGHDRLWQSGEKLLAAARGFDSARLRFAEIAGRDIPAASVSDLGELAGSLGALVEAQHLLRDWSVW